jgi:hypothetical protein
MSIEETNQEEDQDEDRDIDIDQGNRNKEEALAAGRELDMNGRIITTLAGRWVIWF